MEKETPEARTAATIGVFRTLPEDSQLGFSSALLRGGVAVRVRAFKKSVPKSREGPVMTKSGFAKEHLKSFIDRIERLEEERNALTADIREVYSEAKGQGFDAKIMRQVVRLRKLDTADRQEQDAILDLYMSALGMRR